MLRTCPLAQPARRPPSVRAAIEQPRAEADERGYVLVFVPRADDHPRVRGVHRRLRQSWYNRSAQIKRAADAAALAGVVWMPEFDLAGAVRPRGRGQATGSSTGVNNISIDGRGRPEQQPPARGHDPRQRGQAVLLAARDPEPVDRARRRSPSTCCRCRSGSPKNTFGTGDLLGGADRENFWAAVSGYCSGHESGDKKLSKYESYSTAASTSACNNGSTESTTTTTPTATCTPIELPANADVAEARGVRRRSTTATGSNCRRTASWRQPDRHHHLQGLRPQRDAARPHATSRSCRRTRSRSTSAAQRVDLHEQLDTPVHVDQPAGRSVLRPGEERRGRRRPTAAARTASASARSRASSFSTCTTRSSAAPGTRRRARRSTA